MRTGTGIVLAILSALGACGREKPPPPPAEARYVVPAPWQDARGVWFYPSARFGGGFSGLAVAMTRASRGDRTTDGAAFDPAVPAAAVQSLQLPVVLRVTDLLNGRQMLVRADDLGPADPGRVIALDAACLRALAITGVTPVSVAIDPALSQAVADQLGGMPRATSTAPLGAVSEAPLGPPGSAPPPTTGAPPPQDAAREMATAGAPSVPRTVETVPVGPVSLLLDAGTFSGAAAARDVARAAGGIARPEGGGRDPVWRVTRGPFGSIAEADAALDQAEAAGISGARIVAQDQAEDGTP